MGEGEYFFGRLDENSLYLKMITGSKEYIIPCDKAKYVSKKHLKITVDRGYYGKCIKIEDLNSTNGTYCLESTDNIDFKLRKLIPNAPEIINESNTYSISEPSKEKGLFFGIRREHIITHIKLAEDILRKKDIVRLRKIIEYLKSRGYASDNQEWKRFWFWDEVDKNNMLDLDKLISDLNRFNVLEEEEKLIVVSNALRHVIVAHIKGKPELFKANITPCDFFDAIEQVCACFEHISTEDVKPHDIRFVQPLPKEYYVNQFLKNLKAYIDWYQRECGRSSFSYVPHERFRLDIEKADKTGITKIWLNPYNPTLDVKLKINYGDKTSISSLKKQIELELKKVFDLNSQSDDKKRAQITEYLDFFQKQQKITSEKLLNMLLSQIEYKIDFFGNKVSTSDFDMYAGYLLGRLDEIYNCRLKNIPAATQLNKRFQRGISLEPGDLFHGCDPGLFYKMLQLGIICTESFRQSIDQTSFASDFWYVPAGGVQYIKTNAIYLPWMGENRSGMLAVTRPRDSASYKQEDIITALTVPYNEKWKYLVREITYFGRTAAYVPVGVSITDIRFIIIGPNVDQKQVKNWMVLAGIYIPLYVITGNDYLRNISGNTRLVFTYEEFESLSSSPEALSQHELISSEDNAANAKINPGIKPEKDIEKTLLDRANLDRILNSRDYSIINLIGFFKPKFKEDYETQVVAEGYTLEEHTQMVLGQFEKYYSTSLHAEDIKLFRVLFALHDIGKPKALREHNKNMQHKYTVDILKELFSNLNFSEHDKALCLSLISADPIGPYLRGNSSPEQAIGEIRTMHTYCKDMGNDMAISKFFNYLMMYYICDASSYTKDSTYYPTDMLKYPNHTLTHGIESLDYYYNFYIKPYHVELKPKYQEKIDSLRNRLQD